MEVLSTARKIGGSMVTTLPKRLVEMLGIHEDDILKMRVEKVKKDYFGCLKGIGKMTKEDELDTHE